MTLRETACTLRAPALFVTGTLLSLWGCGNDALFTNSPILAGSGGAGAQGGGGQGPGAQGPGAQGPGGQGPGGNGGNGGNGAGPGPGGAGGDGGDGGDAVGGGGNGGEGGFGPMCGNNLAEPPEECDTTDLAGQDCTDHGYSNPAGLSCVGCAFNTGTCIPVCNGVLEPTEPCDDGNDDPFDGCDECVLVTPPVGSCASPIQQLVPAGLTTVAGATAQGGSQTTDQCDGEELSRDIIYAVTPTVDGFLTVFLSNTDANYDSMIYVMDDCANSASGIVCADNFPNGKETLAFRVTANETYHVVVDGWNGAEGNFTLNMVLTAGTCADPVVFPLWPGIGMPAVGTTTGLVHDHTSTGCGGFQAGDVVFAVVPQFDGEVDAVLDGQLTNYDAVLSGRRTCDSALTQFDCDRNGMAGGDEAITANAANGTPFFVWVDGFNNAEGSFALEFTP